MDGQLATGLGPAWLAATIALAIHVADEATHDFLAWYNPRALRIRTALGGFPFPPAFTFLPWLIGLVAAVLLLAALTPVAYRGASWMPAAALILAAIHVGNGLIHLLGSVQAKRLVPGALSAPVLLLAGAWLGYAAATLR